MVAAERVALADTLDTLTDEDWATPSLCRGWTVRDVVAHLTLPLTRGLPQLMFDVARYRFDFDRFTLETATSTRSTGPELAGVLRARRDHRFAPPGLGPVAPLTDVVVHGQDIRRPLGRPYELAADRARPILDFLVSPPAMIGFVRRDRIRGLSWAATDVDWRRGTGPAVEGPAEAVILALLGRRAAYADLAGPGVEILTARDGKATAH